MAQHLQLMQRLLSGAMASSCAAPTLISSSESLARVAWGSWLHRRRYAAEPAQAPAGETLVIDDTAVTRLKELAAEKPGEPAYLRIEVEGGGCSGFQYKFRLDQGATQPDDMTFEKGGTRIVCDPVSFQFLKGAKVEYEDSLMRSAFTISSNPNSESSCGCGTSFVAKMK